MKALLSLVAVVMVVNAADAPPANLPQWIESLGGEVVRDPVGAIVEVSLARTWATDNDIERVAEIRGLKRLDLSFTFISDRGVEGLQHLKQIEESTLDTPYS